MTRERTTTVAGPPPLTAARRVLRDVFGYGEFRPGQAEVISAVLESRDTLAVMPTGGGKSVCYQVPALLENDGITLVVSPLLALMTDQVAALHARGVAAAAVNSSIPVDDQRRTLADAAEGRLQLLYVAPERFGNGSFVAALRGIRVALLAIDEAHCVSQWGHDFRPSYRELGGVRQQLGNPPVVALTATADPRVREDILLRLQLRDPVVHVAGFDRPNLRFEVQRVSSLKEKSQAIADELRALKQESAIVYCGTRKRVEEVTDFLQRSGVKCARYHAGMEDNDRKRIQDAFARDTLRVIVATNAFGMGIDKPDVRMVIHHDMPDSLESYYQEAGRAGRDGEPARCILYYSPRDRSLREFFIEMAHPEAARVVEVYRALASAGERVHVRELMREDDEPGINAAVQALVESGLAARRGWQVSAIRLDGEADIDTAGLDAHREHSFAKLDAMEDYARSRTCLRARILAYFGDTAHEPACGNCAPCTAGTLTPAETHAAAEDDLFQQLRAVRRDLANRDGIPPFVVFSDATLRDMARKRPRNQSEMLRVSGVGQVKFEKYGEPFLAVTRAAAGTRQPAAGPSLYARAEARKAGVMGPTLRETLSLYKDGIRDINEMARARAMARSTIAGHLADLLLAGAIEHLDGLVPVEKLTLIREATGDRPFKELGPVKERLGDKVTYEDLHLVRAYQAARHAPAPH